MTKKLAALVLGLAALVLNPFFACSARERGYDFGADEMRAAVAGTWTITVPASGPGSPAIEYTVTITQGTREIARADASGLVAPAVACGSRSFVRTASACLDVTKMPLDVQIVDEMLRRRSSEGELMVYGNEFRSGRLDLTLDGKELRAMVSSSGMARDAVLTVGGSERDVEMARIAPAAPVAVPAGT